MVSMANVEREPVMGSGDFDPSGVQWWHDQKRQICLTIYIIIHCIGRNIQTNNKKNRKKTQKQYLSNN